ncbi:MAG: N-acetylmuramoyl-L-alanine amidase [Candidatus Ozemobacter sibiricus]|uniref:N-acetylmuramoyl-L-alanine amidase n=1 Tax=Candidatus Ozemobacter sibiricus TaxID=2268124 RepID=A0A367ZIA1_9BACT|nr:MAG: N-acetylmuramoyl-L-alanine amidase [Candidatus Ozemobacter sibiricus]
MTRNRHRDSPILWQLAIKLLFISLLFGGIPGLAPVEAALASDQGCRITDIRFWQSPEEAQIVIDLSAPPQVTPLGTLTDGTVFFDIEKCVFRPGRQRYPLNNPFIQTLNVQARSDGSVRVYFRTGPGVTQRTFVLPRNEAKPDRVVIFLTEPAQNQLARRQQEQLEINRLKAGNVKIVVLDAGHGGEDPGTRGGGIIEKDYVLAMARLIKNVFDRDPRYRAILTRNGDYIIPLERRRQMAEQLGADVFVSIHVNYNRARHIQGIEVYYESPKGAVGEADRLVAELENQQDLVGGVGQTAAPPVAAKQDIVKKQAEIMYRSGQLAGRVEARLAQAVPGLGSRGVRRAGFKVLHSLAMPSILVELGYVSNPVDASFLRNPSAQLRLAQAVYQGVVDFLESQVQPGLDASYVEYVSQVEAARRAQEERARQARLRRQAMLARSQPYTVQKGDTIPKIVNRFKVGKSQFLELNQFSPNRKLKVGEVVRIPGK